MRSPFGALLLALMVAGPVAAQDAPRPDTAFERRAAAIVQPPGEPGAAADSAGSAVRPGTAGPAVQEAAQEFTRREPWFRIPDAPATAGARTVAAGQRIAGDVAARGDLEIFGTVDGTAVAYGGDVVVHPGGRVGGDAVAVLGRVRLEGGSVDGEMRAVRGSLDPVPAAAARAPLSMHERVGLVVGWFAVLALMGVGVLVFASGPLDAVVERLELGFGRAFLAGLAGQAALVPVLLLLVIALAITILGALLIPFAVVGYVIAAAGLMTLGFLGVARVIGGALTGRSRALRLTERGAALRGLVLGIGAFIVVWLAAALLAPFPLAATVVRGLAFALSWVAVTAGFGAAILSRAGTRRAVGPVEPEPEPEEEISWQTPTPIGGVVAARRPTSASR
jgi:hypothetical protein